MDYLYHQLLRLEGVDYVLSKGFSLYGIGEVFGHFVIDVGVKKSTAYILKCFRYIDFGYLTLSFEQFEASLKPFA